MQRFGTKVHALLGLGLALVGVALMGCHAVRTAARLPAQAVKAVAPGKQSPDPVMVQQALIRFTDEFMARMIFGIDGLRRGTNTPDPAEVLRWKIDFGTETCSIVSGPNAMANLLDMTVFATAVRMTAEEYWAPKLFGESAHALLESCRTAENEIWQFDATVLKPEQRKELLRAIEKWHRQNPQPENLLGARTVSLAAQAAKATPAESSQPGSVFSFLRLDPLSSLDPATRELAQTRLFAERALYVTQKMPMVLRWQAELLSLNTLNLPTVQQLVTNSSELTASMERFAVVAEKLPGQLSAEREAILKELQSQEKSLTPLVNEVQQALAQGAQMSTSLNTTLTTFDKVIQRLGVGETNSAGPPGTNSQPFRIQDYTQSAAQLEATARRLTEMLVTLDQTLGSTNLAQLSAQVSPAVQQAEAGGKQVVDYAFRKGLLLLAFVLVAAVVYRLLSARLGLAGRSQGPLTK
jgi:hypothetical protein